MSGNSDTVRLNVPPPPLAAFTWGDLTVERPPTTLRLVDRAVRRGRLLRFDAAARCVELAPEGGGAPETVSFDAIKALQTLLRRELAPGTLPDGERDALETEPRDFEVVFADGDRMRGHTRGFREDSQGLYLFPVAEEDRIGLLFVPRSALRDWRIGPLIGETLIASGAVDGDTVRQALDRQREQRERPLGATLQEQALVTVAELEDALARQKSVPDRKIGEILVDAGFITREQLEHALDSQRGERAKPIGELLVEMGHITHADLQAGLARKLGIPRVDLGRFYVDQEIARLVPEEVVRRTRVIPLYDQDNRLVVATDNPLDWRSLEEVTFVTGRHVDPVMADGAAIDRTIELMFSQIGAGDLAIEDLDLPPGEEDVPEEPTPSALADNVVVALVNRVIMGAYLEHASDIHVESGGAREKTVVRIRKDGVLRPLVELRPRLRRAVVARIKVMAGLDVTERRQPQDGRIDLRRFGKAPIELRVAVVPTVGGEEDVVMRILAGAHAVPIAELGLSAHNHRRLVETLAHPHGLLLVCGPTGSGKTTTLHSLLGHISTGETKIWTAEDPVEIVQPGMRQVQVNAVIGFTFARALRAFLRADPDVIMIGEMRDEETAHIAVEAALTGHLVLSTLHTNSAPETVSRLLDLGINPFNFADSLVGVLAQRLVRTLCPDCRVPESEPNGLLAELASEYAHEMNGGGESAAATLARWREEAGGADSPLRLQRRVGCKACNGSGYSGRVALHELFVVTPALRPLVQRRTPAAELRAEAQRAGMRTLKQDGIEKVLAGATDIHEVRRACA